MRKVTVTLGGKKWKLVYDYAALCELCDAIGATISNIQETMNALRMGQMHLVLWAGMIDQEPDLDEKQVKAWLKDVGSIPDAQAILQQAMEGLNQAMVRSKAGQDQEEGEEGTTPVDPQKPTTTNP